MYFAQHVDLAGGHLFDFLNLLVRVGAVFEFQFQEFTQREVFNDFAGHLRALGHDFASRAFVHELVGDDLALE